MTSDDPPAGDQAGRGYHHGDLRAALLDAAEAILAERGAEGFTLREAARRAGVSPAAPSHHFGNAAGLLAAVAALGFDDLSDRMEMAAAAAGGEVAARLEAICRAYLDFALQRPGRFRVTFGPSSRPAKDAHPALMAAAARAFGILRRESAAARPAGGAAEEPEGELAEGMAAAVFVWSLVHGLATLLLDGRLGFVARRAAVEETAAVLVPAVLARLRG